MADRGEKRIFNQAIFEGFWIDQAQVEAEIAEPLRTIRQLGQPGELGTLAQEGQPGETGVVTGAVL
jgi:hypothetical protein